MYKKIIFSLIFLGLVNVTFAKKVKFAVDMSTHTISPLGIHVIGDFQVAAGFPLDFDATSILMNQQGATTIYTVIVNIPAFRKYEYKFVNGDQTYEVEIIPDQARVDPIFNDNRWLYVDSLANDTTFAGAIVFGENAPAGKTLVRYKVDMYNLAIPNTGVHVASTYQGNNPATVRLYNLTGNTYEIIAYMNLGTQSYKFFNGNNNGTSEAVPNPCATAGNRTHNVIKDTVLPTVCFSSCAACIVGLKENTIEDLSLDLFPNPASDLVNINIPDGAEEITVFDFTGKIVDVIGLDKNNLQTLSLDVKKYTKGIYHVYLKNGSIKYSSRLIIE